MFYFILFIQWKIDRDCNKIGERKEEKKIKILCKFLAIASEIAAVGPSAKVLKALGMVLG